MESPGTHGIADSSGMALFGFGATGGPIVTPIGQTYSFAFQWAGAYAYDDPFHTKTKGGVSVPISVTRVVGVPETANVVWASGDAPAGFAFDVLIQSPRATGFLPWRTGVTNLSQTFGPSDRRGRDRAGTRSRLGCAPCPPEPPADTPNRDRSSSPEATSRPARKRGLLDHKVPVYGISPSKPPVPLARHACHR
jgi:hypothetical protein